jgi:hypothetical protein
MAKIGLAALAFAAILGLGVTPASALGDTCYRDVSARGDVRSTYRGAMASAIGAWQFRAARATGGRATDWYYSVDRTLDCVWNDPGTRIQCTAKAVPCARKRR